MPGTIRQRLRHRPFGRLLALAAVLGTVLLMMFGSVETVPAAEAATPSPFYFGTLITQPEHAAEESAKGVKVAMLELGWDSYEPTEGHFDAGYARTMKARYDALKAQGMQVTLALGLHYPPQWVFAFPNSRYVDQRGRTSPEVNLIFNQTLRSKAERYLARVDMDLGLKNFWAVRLTSGGDAEVLYPGGGSYWAFDQNAQNGPDLPPTMPRNPSPGWRPGDRSISTGSVGTWADWYVKALDDVVDWQMRSLNGLGFGGYFQILTPGSGSRPSGLSGDVANYLPDGITGVGAVWDQFYKNLPNKQRTVAYVSSIADRSGGDDSCRSTDDSVALSDPSADGWSATRWVSRIADQYGMPKNGENPGWNMPASLNSQYVDPSSSGMMATTMRQMSSCHLQGVYWAHDDKLWDGTVPFSRYADYIAGINGSASPAPDPPYNASGPQVPAQAVSIDDALIGSGVNAFSYSLGWGHCSGCGSGGLYQGTTSWSETAGSTVTLQFTGVGFSLYGEGDPRHGIGAVSVDGGPEQQVDYYASTRSENQIVLTTTGLANQMHRLQLRVTGRKRSVSTGNIVPIDRVAVMSAS